MSCVVRELLFLCCPLLRPCSFSCDALLSCAFVDSLAQRDLMRSQMGSEGASEVPCHLWSCFVPLLPQRTGHLLSVCKMSPVKSAAQDHLCHSRRLSAVPHTSLCYLVHSACLVEARLFISHWLHDPKEMSNAPESQTPKTHVFGAIGTRDSKQSPRVTHTHLGSSFLEILPLLLLGKEVLRATVSQTSSKTSFLTEIPTAMSRWSTSCLMSSPPSFGSRAAHRPGTVLDLITAAPHLESDVLRAR